MAVYLFTYILAILTINLSQINQQKITPKCRQIFPSHGSYGFDLPAKPVQVVSLNYYSEVRDQDLAEAIAKRRLGLLHQVAGGGMGGKFLQVVEMILFGFFRFKGKRVVAYKSPTWQGKNL